MEKPRIGFVGAGLMGHGMAKHILLKGYPLAVVAHRNRAPVDDLVARGAREAADPAALAESCDVVVLCVTSPAAVEAVCLGPRGIIEGGRPGLVVADASTSDPAVTLRVAERLAEKGIRMADVPVTRSPREAEEGRLNTLMAGDREVMDILRPVVGCYSENIFEIGPLGAAVKLKLINNLLSLGHAVLACEALAAAERVGVEPGRLFEVVSAGGANSAMFQMIAGRYLEGHDDGLKFTLRNARKDLRCYQAMIDETGMPSPMAEATRQLLSLATALGHGDAFVGALARVLRAMDEETS